MKYNSFVEQWGVFEASFQGPKEGNPFLDHCVKAIFHYNHNNTKCNPNENGLKEDVCIEGFYDGNGIYKVRFMPPFEGDYEFTVQADFLEEAYKGSFQALTPSGNNHGPVRTAYRYHMAYEDGTPYYSIGTTCYVWELQSDELIEQTIQTLRASAFNKLRFCIFPKHYDYNLGEPRAYPYIGTPMDSSVLTKDNFNEYTGMTEGNHWDYYQFNPDYFRHIEKCIVQLMEMGIEADLILFHPYDRWGFSRMSAEQDDFYLNYVIRRFAAYRNVWWSLANEYDLMETKGIRDWERLASILCKKDVYGHLRSIHNCRYLYDYSRPWITHCSVQRIDLYKSAEEVNALRSRYQKPVLLDEIAYEGNIQFGWGNITAEEMTRRFWEAACRGGYPGHGETYINENDILWWSHGGKLSGESYKRFAFLLDILKQTPGIGLCPCEKGEWDEVCAVPEIEAVKQVKSYYLIYYSFMRPSFRDYYFDDNSKYLCRVIDTWNMTIEEQGIVQGKFRVKLPGRQYMAVQLTKVE